MKTIVKNFSNYFVKELEEFVKNKKSGAIRAGLTNNEINAVITETFYILGKQHKMWTEKSAINKK